MGISGGGIVLFKQLLTPVGDSLALSFVVAALPIVVVLLGLGVLRRPAWQASLAGLIVAFLIAVGVWDMPSGLAQRAIANGAVFALWPVMWIVFNAMFLYNIAYASGRFDAFRRWTLEHLPNDRRVVLVAIGFCFGALLEGVAGFGTPVAITSSLLILVGFEPLEALVFVLIFNTAPVAFGALGAPVTVLGAVTGLPAATLGAMIGRQLPFMALILPFYVMFAYGGLRSIAALWPVLLVSGGSFALSQFVASNYIDYALTDVLASMGSLIVTLGFLTIWKPRPDPEFAIAREAAAEPGDRADRSRDDAPAREGDFAWTVLAFVILTPVLYSVLASFPTLASWLTLSDELPFQPLIALAAMVFAVALTAPLIYLRVKLNPDGVDVPKWQGWLPWIVVSVVVILWTSLKIPNIEQTKMPWPGLDQAISITLYNDKPYDAIWTFQPLASGTGIFAAALLTAVLCGIGPIRLIEAFSRTVDQITLAVFTVCLIVGLAYLMNYSGLAYTLGKGVASVGGLFVLLSPFLGWVAVFLSGSDTSGNALFGNLQVVAAKQLNLSPVLFAAANSSGGVMGKMISPQNIATGVSVTSLRGQEGKVFARTFPHSIVLTLIFALLVAAQQYLIPWIIPG
jgi:lactate permease